VQAVPTLLVLDRGEVIARQAGAATAPALRLWVDQALAGRSSATAGSPGSGGTP
jgi:thioredoxin 2